MRNTGAVSMIRMAGIVLIFWGMIAQPLMAGMLAQKTDNSTHSTMMSDADVSVHANDHSYKVEHAGESSAAPCHEAAADEPSSEPCIYCDVDCVNNGLCAFSCVVGGAAAVQKSVVNLEFQSTDLIFAIPEALATVLSSRIFHPPKPS